MRHATKEDVDNIKALIRSSGFHSPGARKGKRIVRGKGRLRGALSKLLSPLFTSSVDWRNYVVAVSNKGTLIGCVQIKPKKGGIWEVTKLAVDESWRGMGVPLVGSEFVFANFPHPLWGTCISTLVPLYERLGAVEVVDPEQMPPFLHRRQRWFNAFFRLARKKQYLAVIVANA